jgi:hypothetical protein
MIDVMHALSGPSQWKEAIRALCHAKVAFMDISNYSPGTMMLLGVRSVVRRGVTITLRTHEGSLPWNIREIKPVELHKLRFRQEAYNLFSSVLRDAWQRFCTEPAYSDLPVYDAIRSLSTADHSRIPPTQQILVLCSFSDRHKNQNWPLIERTLQLASAELESFKGTMLEPVSVIRTLDMHSTTLVGHALYNAIRRSAFCIIDWTDWRPSVFFEFGVRLAASDIRPICLIEFEESTASPFQGQVEALLKLFTPIQYRIPEMAGVGNAIKQQFEAILGTATDTASSAALPYDETYRVAVDAFEVEHDQNIIPPPHVELRRLARTLRAPLEYATNPVLYSENIRIRRLAEEAALERLLAAWFYLIGRYTDEELRSTVSLRRELVSVGNETLEAMRGVRMQHVIREIYNKLKQMRALDEEVNSRGPD